MLNDSSDPIHGFRLTSWFEIWFAVGYRLCSFNMLSNQTIKSSIPPSSPVSNLIVIWKPKIPRVRITKSHNISSFSITIFLIGNVPNNGYANAIKTMVNRVSYCQHNLHFLPSVKAQIIMVIDDRAKDRHADHRRPIWLRPTMASRSAGNSNRIEMVKVM